MDQGCCGYQPLVNSPNVPLKMAAKTVSEILIAPCLNHKLSQILQSRPLTRRHQVNKREQSLGIFTCLANAMLPAKRR